MYAQQVGQGQNNNYRKKWEFFRVWVHDEKSTKKKTQGFFFFICQGSSVQAVLRPLRRRHSRTKLWSRRTRHFQLWWTWWFWSSMNKKASSPCFTFSTQPSPFLAVFFFSNLSYLFFSSFLTSEASSFSTFILYYDISLKKKKKKRLSWLCWEGLL